MHGGCHGGGGGGFSGESSFGGGGDYISGGCFHCGRFSVSVADSLAEEVALDIMVADIMLPSHHGGGSPSLGRIGRSFDVEWHDFRNWPMFTTPGGKAAAHPI